MKKHKQNETRQSRIYKVKKRLEVNSCSSTLSSVGAAGVCAGLTTSVPGAGGARRPAGRVTVTPTKASTPIATRRLDSVAAK